MVYEIPKPTEQLETFYLQALPLFVSIPRSGCNWVQAVMEVYFDRHRALKNINSPSWMSTPFADPLWMHTHDNFNERDVETSFPAIFLWRDPTEVIYSLLKLHGLSPGTHNITSYCNRFTRCYKKWTDRPGTIVLCYQDFLDNPLEEMKRISEHFKVFWNEDRAKYALELAGDKKTTNQKNGEHKAFKNPASGEPRYELERESFRKEWGQFIAKQTSWCLKPNKEDYLEGWLDE